MRIRRQRPGHIFKDNLAASLRRYGVDMEWYERRMQECREKCEICGGEPTGNHTRLAIDHNHATMKARGLLCGMCNQAIGAMKDNPELFEKAARYLRERTYYGA